MRMAQLGRVSAPLLLPAPGAPLVAPGRARLGAAAASVGSTAHPSSFSSTVKDRSQLQSHFVANSSLPLGCRSLHTSSGGSDAAADGGAPSLSAPRSDQQRLVHEATAHFLLALFQASNSASQVNKAEVHPQVRQRAATRRARLISPFLPPSTSAQLIAFSCLSRCCCC